MDIWMMLILPIHGQGISFHLFMSSSVSFFSVLQFYKYMSLTSLVKFIPRSCIFVVVAIVNGTFFLVSLSDSSSLVYKNAIDFWILTLYPATLPNSLSRSSIFFGGAYRIFYVHYLSCANNDCFNSSLPNWMPFVSSSFLVTVARTSSAKLNSSGESGHPCLVPGLE